MTINEGNPVVAFSGDIPLINPADDKLNYAPFSKLLAQSVAGMCPKECIVMAINGPWGSGKSTVLNFVLHYLESDYAGQPVMPIRFNPWWFSGREDLTRLLMGLIRARLGDKDYGEIKSMLADLTDLLTKIPGIPGKDAGEFIADKLRGQPDLVSLKDKIDELLLSSNKRLLIIIDDIDRLAPDEICDLFRTIKATGNFPNVIYLLAFEIDIVVKSLEKTFIPCGHSYLEKIVQVPFALPMPDKVKLRKLLFSKLNEVLANAGEENFSDTYWANIYLEGIDHFINTPRDIIRLINALQATYPCVKGEVNSVDFIAIETIRVFMPEFYDVIRMNQDILVGENSISQQWKTRDKKKAIFESWLEALPEGDRVSAKHLLSRLFPEFNSAFGGALYGSEWQPTWRKQLRICSSDIFPLYFRFSLDVDAISNSEIKKLLSIARDSGMFGQTLLEYACQIRSDGSSRVRAVLERLGDYAEKDIPEQEIRSIVSAFFDVGDSLLLECDERRGLFDYGNNVRMSRLINQLLRRVDEKTRFEIISSAIQEGSAVAMVVYETVIWGQEHGKFSEKEPRPEGERTFTTEHLDIIESFVVGKIIEAAKEGILLSTPTLVDTLYAWTTWTNSDEQVRKWVREIVETDEGLISFLQRFGSIRQSWSLGDVVARHRYRLDPKSLEPFIDPKDIVNRVRMICDKLDLNAEQKKAISEFLHEYDLRQKGLNPD
jgi:predicted KAP-like P-loop ATPase